MRIIAGKYGGRKLAAFKADHIRPTTDRIKEVIFNKIQGQIEGARVLDLFSGTGSLTFEALSRGADSVLSVEMSAKSIQLMNKNKKLLAIGKEMEILQKDVIKFLSQYTGAAFDIILVDPPFTKKMASEVLEILAKSTCLGSDTEVFIESSAKEEVLDVYGSLILNKRQSYGDKFLSHYQYQ